MMEQAQLAKELHKPKRKHFRTIPVIVKYPHESWQADLADMSHLKRWNKGHTFLLCVIDTFSKFAFARPLKSKRAQDVHDAFKDILLESNVDPPRFLQSDAGGEFFNAIFQKLMSKHGITHYFTHSDKKASIVERFQRTLKSRMYKAFTQNNSLNWISILPELIYDYNYRTKHSTINAKPIDATKPKNAKTIHQNILASRRRRQSSSKPKYRAGDFVRVSRKKNIFEKSYTPNWTEELFKIYRVQMTRPRTYKLQDLLGVPIGGTFYAEELQKTKIPHYARIEKVIRRKGNMARVKWKGYDSRFNEWIPLSRLTKL